MYKEKRPENMCAPDSRFNVAINPKYGKKEEHFVPGLVHQPTDGQKQAGLNRQNNE